MDPVAISYSRSQLHTTRQQRSTAVIPNPQRLAKLVERNIWCFFSSIVSTRGFCYSAAHPQEIMPSSLSLELAYRGRNLAGNDEDDVHRLMPVLSEVQEADERDLQASKSTSQYPSVCTRPLSHRCFPKHGSCSTRLASPALYSVSGFLQLMVLN